VGANAVNGVINIITKPAAATQGTLVTGAIGNEERGAGAVRFGDAFADGTGHYRVYAKHTSRGPGLTSSGEDASDDFDRSRAGFRADWKTDQDNAFTAQGDITTVRSGEIATVFEPVAPFARTLDERGRLLNPICSRAGPGRCPRLRKSRSRPITTGKASIGPRSMRRTTRSTSSFSTMSHRWKGTTWSGVRDIA